MTDKQLKKEYDKNRVQVLVWLNAKEKTVFDKLMEEEGWNNRSGFIKDRIFRGKLDTRYQKILLEADKEDTLKILKNQMTELVNTIGYLNYRFTYELDRIENSEDDDAKEKARRLNKMREWKTSVLGRTEDIASDLRAILGLVGVKIEKERSEQVRYAPDSLLEKATRNWNDISSPEAHELARRQHEKLREKMMKQ